MGDGERPRSCCPWPNQPAGPRRIRRSELSDDPVGTFRSDSTAGFAECVAVDFATPVVDGACRSSPPLSADLWAERLTTLAVADDSGALLIPTPLLALP